MIKVNNDKGQESFRKYRWFYTSSRKLVYGGKNSLQNEEVVKDLLNSENDYIVMHTKSPGSPFTILKADSFSEKDLEEMAIFTACFSRAWREKAKKVAVDIFRASQIFKSKGMKAGTFGVKGKIKRKIVGTKLYLAVQKKSVRFVPQKKARALCIVPGSISKDKISELIAVKMDVSLDEVMQAIPTGGSDFFKS